MRCYFGHRKVCYRDIADTGAHVVALIALANLFLDSTHWRPRYDDAGLLPLAAHRKTAELVIAIAHPF